jgi:hypothetical protein
MQQANPFQRKQQTRTEARASVSLNYPAKDCQNKKANYFQSK